MNKTSVLAQQITKSSSYQTYITIKLLANKSQINNFYLGYAYFRWVDDMVDDILKKKSERIKFIERQARIIEESYAGKKVSNLSKEERIITELIKTDKNKESKLASYIINFLAIIEFDAHRKGELINQEQLDWYVKTLAKAVMDGILYFVVYDKKYKDSDDHYLAAMGAFVVHMLRDMGKDLPEGYVNIPKEHLVKDLSKSKDVRVLASKKWVKERVDLARNYFIEGKKIFDKTPVLRYKIATFWYCARFEPMLDLIKKDGFVLRLKYEKNKSFLGKLKFAGLALTIVFKHYYSLTLGSFVLGRD